MEVYKLIISIYKQNTQQLSSTLWNFIKKIIYEFTEYEQVEENAKSGFKERKSIQNWFGIKAQNQPANPFLQEKQKEEEKTRQSFLSVEQTEMILRKSIVERISIIKESKFSNSLDEKDIEFAQSLFQYNIPYIQQLILKCYGDLYNPQNDLIAKLGFDMLAYMNKDLHKEVVHLISQHFNQINLIGFNLQTAVLMLNQQSCNIVKNIKQLKRQFIYYTSGIRLPESPEQLDKIIQALRSSDVNHPALTDYIFADDTSIRCQQCKKWFESSEKAKQCCKDKISESSIDKTRIKSSHQELLRLLNVHQVVAQFIVKQSLSSSFKGYLKKEQELYSFKYAYEFLYCFVLNNKKNQTQLSDARFMQLFWSHLEVPELAEDAIRLLTELLRDNDLANQMIQNNQIKFLSKLLDPQHKQFKRRLSVVSKYQQQAQFIFSTLSDRKSSEEESELEDDSEEEENLYQKEKEQLKKNPFADMKSPISSKIQFENQVYPVEVLELLKVLVISDQGIKTDKVSVISEIVHDFLKYTEIYSHLLFLNESSELFSKKRKYNFNYLLEQSQKQKIIVKGSNLDFHLQFMDLIGILTLGQGVAVESFIKENLFRHEDMIDLMTSDYPVHLKQPFIRFCHGIYFSEIGEEEEVVEGAIGQQQYVIHLLRENGKYMQQMLRNVITDIKKLTQCYKDDDIVHKQDYSYYVFQVLLPFLTQLHNENHLSILKDSEHEISQESKNQIASLFEELLDSVIEMIEQRQSVTYDNQKSVLLSFINAFVKSNTIMDVKLAKNDSTTLLNLRQQIQSSICSNSDDIKTLNQFKLTRFILKVCLPKILQLFYGIVQEILLEKNQNKDKIKQDVQILRHEQQLENVDYSYYVLVQQLKKLIFDVQFKQQRLLEKVEEEDEKALQFDYQNLIKQAFQQKLEKVGYKIEHKDYQNHIKGGQLLLNHLLTQCQVCYQSNTSTSIYLIQTFQSVFILCGGIVRSINETQIEVSEYETPKDLLLAQNVLIEDGVRFVINFVSQINFPLSQASKTILKEVMKFAVLLTTYGNNLVQKELIDYYSMQCNKQLEGANFLRNIKNLFSQQANDLASLMPDEALQEVSIFVLRFLKNWCEGHNLEAQNFIREQQHLRINVRVVLQISNLAKSLATRFKKYYLFLNEKNSDHKILLKYLKKCLPTSERKRRYID